MLRGVRGTTWWRPFTFHPTNLFSHRRKLLVVFQSNPQQTLTWSLSFKAVGIKWLFVPFTSKKTLSGNKGICCLYKKQTVLNQSKGVSFQILIIDNKTKAMWYEAYPATKKPNGKKSWRHKHWHFLCSHYTHAFVLNKEWRCVLHNRRKTCTLKPSKGTTVHTLSSTDKQKHVTCCDNETSIKVT